MDTLTPQTKNPSKGRGPVFEWRRAAGLSQSAAAATLGCPLRTLARWEGEGKTPAPNTLAGAKFARLTKSRKTQSQ